MHEFRCYDNIHVYKLIALFTASAYSTEYEIAVSLVTYYAVNESLCFMVALCNRADHIYFHAVSSFFFFYFLA